MDQPHLFDSHTASSVAQVNQGRAQDLGRGPCVINMLQSQQKENKLCEQRLLNAKGYNIVRRDRASGGAGLMFLICDVHFHRLPDIGNDTSDLEYLGITVPSKDCTITIKNVYHPKIVNILIQTGWKPSNEDTNAIISDNGHVSVDAREAAEALAHHYANESRLAFSSYDKNFARVTRNQEKSCRERPADNPLFNVDFTLPELSYALQNLDTIKSPGPDSIPGHFLSHFGILDMSKAFDRVWNYKLLSKGSGVFSIKGKALPWISNFLNHRNFCVNFHATFSDSYKTYQEIPQGCVLSPTLFSLFISAVEKYVNPSQIGLFADDAVLWCSDANISKMESQLNRSLVNIQEFADNHEITFNALMSTVRIFTTNRHLYNYSPEIFLMSECLNYSKYPTYLGFTLDSEVNCSKHIEKIADKARKRLKILKYLSSSDWGLDASTLRITYTTLVRPVFEYE
ncbi:putative RNA-directed DNA polymerase from transposon BS [Trichonephila clavipes]|nr:putative RNA-directed DNA polymerase from transposon BS [Trichonephila clavipes]